MRRLVAVLLILGAAIGAAIGALWTLMKASGAEVDVCNGPSCTSGWHYAGPILAGAVVIGVIGVIGVALLRGERHDSRPGDA